jgi:hypothetical protein
MQLLKITNIPLEYKFNVEEASLVAIKDDKYKPLGNSSTCNVNCTKENNKCFLKDNIDFDNVRAKGSESKESENGSVKNNCNCVTAAAINEYVKSQNMLQKSIKSNSKQEPLDQARNNNDELEIIDEYKLEYKAGSFEIEIIRRPDVDIEYVGGFSYVPPSSDPNYNE